MSEKENASFLKLIGLDEDQAMNAAPEEHYEEDFVAAEVTPATEDTATLEDNSEDEAFFEEFSATEEASQATADFTEVEDSQATLKDEDHVDEEIVADFPSEDSSPAWSQTDVSAREVFEDLGPENSNPNNRTAVYSNEEFEKVIDRPLRKEFEKADRLLDGLEDAPASRATDVFAKSYRLDARQTSSERKHISDPFDQFDEDSFAEDLYGDSVLESNSDLEALEHHDEGTKQISEDPTTEDDAPRRTQAFEYEDTSGIQEQSADHEGDALEPETEVQKLFLIEGPSNRKTIDLNRFPIKIGRDHSNHIVIEDANVSRHHAEIRNEPQGLRLVDLGSANGTKVNGQIALEHYFSDHDLLQVGDTIFEFLDSGSVSRGFQQAQDVGNETVVVTKSKSAEGILSKLRLPSDRKKRIRILALLILVVGGFLFVFKQGGKEKIEKAVHTQINEQIDQQYLRLRNLVEADEGTAVNEVSPERVKEISLSQIEKLPFVPEEIKKSVEAYPPELFKAFLSDNQLYVSLREANFDYATMIQLLEASFKEAYDKRDFEKAKLLNSALLYFNPDSPVLKKFQEEIHEKTKLVQIDKKAGEVTEEQAQKFNEYMSKFQNTIQEMMDGEKYSQALEYAGKVKSGIIELIREQPSYQTMAESAIAEWTAKEKFLKERIQERDEQKKEVDDMVVKGDQLLLEIKAKMSGPGMTKQINEASRLVERFFREFPHHPDLNIAQQYRSEIDTITAAAFESMQREVSSMVQDEKYKPAWDQLYKFLEMVPSFPAALKIKDELAARTKLLGAQFYNKARVFEYETNDLVAAEQFYKKALEAVDPKSDLASKAARRLSQVQQKMAK